MSRLQEATGRLMAAIDRLERVVDRRLEADVGPETRAELISALAAARQENVELAQVSEAVSQRLDGTIERLTVLLED